MRNLIVAALCLFLAAVALVRIVKLPSRYSRTASTKKLSPWNSLDLNVDPTIEAPHLSKSNELP